MSDEAADTSTDRSGDPMPGSNAGDAAHTSQIPRIERADVGNQTDKGRPRPAGAAKSSAPPAKKSPAKKPSANKPSANKSPANKPGKDPVTATSAVSPTSTGPKKPKTTSDGPTGRPLTASDYARTTSQSASSTAVMPAVKDDREAPPRPKTVAPSKKQHQPVAPSVEPSGGRAATLRLSYIEPWSVTRMAFAISVAMMIVAVVAVTIFWVVLDVTGVWDQIDGSVTSVLSDDSSSFRITDYLGFTRLVGLSLVLSALNVVIMTVLATIAAHLYNLAAQLLGGFEMTYTSKD